MARARRHRLPPSEPPILSPGRRRLFTAVAVALPLLVLLLVEAGLRLAGYGGSYPLFVPSPAPDYLVTNQRVAKRYFRAGTLLPTPPLDFLLAEREPRSIRLVFQGESSAAGFPYEHGGAPSRMLEQRLQQTFPDRPIEVVNTALTAVNSYTLLDQAEEIVAQRPDAVLIYTGHNEFYGVFGVGSTRSAGRSRWLIRAYLSANRLRIVQLLDATVSGMLGGLRPEGTATEARTVMEMLAGEQRIPKSSARYQQGLQQFRANLGDLLARYRAAGIPVLIGTVASNERDQRPLVSGLASGVDSAAWRRSYREGLAAMRRGDHRGAEAALRAAVGIDSTAADGLYALARLLDARGDSSGARGYYRAAKEHDQLRFRAPEAINSIIREQAGRHGATVVETQRALQRAAPGGVIGGTLMLEHLHPNLDGYFLIADAFYEALRAHGSIGDWTAGVPAGRARREIPVTAVDSLVGHLRADRLLSGWPFQPRGRAVTPAVDTLRPRTVEGQLAQGLVRETLPWPEAMHRLREHYESRGDLEGALSAARALAQEYDPETEPRMDAARLALALGRHDEALHHLRSADRLGETPRSAHLIGLLLLRRGDHAGAVHSLRRAAELAPGDRRVQLALLAAEAIPGLERERARVPLEPDLLYRLAGAYAVTQQYERAREALAALERVDPDHAGARELLRRLPRRH